MTNKQIETILTQAVEAAYAEQSEEVLSKLGAVEDAVQSAINVLVPFYRGAVVFSTVEHSNPELLCSRPLLSRSGCI